MVIDDGDGDGKSLTAENKDFLSVREKGCRGK